MKAPLGIQQFVWRHLGVPIQRFSFWWAFALQRDGTDTASCIAYGSWHPQGCNSSSQIQHSFPSSRLRSLWPVCIALDEDGQIVANQNLPVEYQHICSARAAYADVFVQFRQAYDSEMVLRDPCRIDPAIDAHEYVKKVSPFVFFGWPLGKHT